ncbi:MAG: ThiF family adenylyltransferase [Thermodesulfovibrionales bacterium]|jgi:molybdopterin/thiamine biosynthesis adenylyltransferase
MKEELYYKVHDRNFGVYNRKEQEKLLSSKIAIIGQGCVGELCSIISVRLGIGHTTIVDYDNLDISNMNRNVTARYSHLGRSKVENMLEFLRDANPTVQINGVNKKLDECNAEEIIRDHDIVLQAMDNMESRIILHRAAYRLNIPCITMSGAPPFRSIMTTVLPDGVEYETLFDLPSKGQIIENNEELKKNISLLKTERARYSVQHGADPEWAEGYISGTRRVWSVTPSRAYICATLCVHEAVNFLTGRALLAPAPKIIEINLDNPINLVQVKEPGSSGTWDSRKY